MEALGLGVGGDPSCRACTGVDHLDRTVVAEVPLLRSSRYGMLGVDIILRDWVTGEARAWGSTPAEVLEVSHTQGVNNIPGGWDWMMKQYSINNMQDRVSTCYSMHFCQ